MPKSPGWYEFFAGGGMARIGLGPGWRCLFANEWCEKKAAVYRRHFGANALKTSDIAALSASDLPGRAQLAWASFPCQDLSLAGAGRGLRGARSGTFWAFWKLIQSLSGEGRAPSLVVLENVAGLLTSHRGEDFPLLIGALHDAGYRCGALVVDAARFLPQSRPRLFVVAVQRDLKLQERSHAAHPQDLWTPASLRIAVERLPARVRASWVWWYLPEPPARNLALEQILESDAEWQPQEETRRLLQLMNPEHRSRVEEAKRLGEPVAGALYRRTRYGVQRAEVRFDGLAGCLRTPAGGSSRQTLLLVEGKSVRSRLFTPREAARLMGLPDDYPLPLSANGAYHLLGDGVAPPVVEWLDQKLLRQICPGQ